MPPPQEDPVFYPTMGIAEIAHLSPHSNWDPEHHLALLEAATSEPSLHTELTDWLTDEFGFLGERLMNQSYIKELKQLAQDLSGATYQTLKLFSADPTLGELIAIREGFGSRARLEELAQALDLGRELPEGEVRTDQPIFTVNNVSFTPKKLEAFVSARFDFGLDPETASISRLFNLTVKEEVEPGTPSKSWDVRHDSFSLAPHMQGKGIARRVLRDSFTWYLEQEKYGCPVASVGLTANVDVGGYAWGLSFDWDRNSMMAGYRSIRSRKEPTAQRLEGEALWRATMGYQMNKYLESTKQFLDQVENLHPEQRAAILKSVQDLQEEAQDPVLCEFLSPQRVVTLGRGVHEFILFEDELGLERWLYGTEPPLEPGHIRKRMHLGKAMALGVSWQGQISLLPQTYREHQLLNLLRSTFQL